MKGMLLSLAWVTCAIGHLSGQDTTAIQSGPMIGHVSMRSAQLWVQTELEAEVAAQYKTSGAADWKQSSTIVTKENSAFTAHIAPWNLWSLERLMKSNVWSTVNLRGNPST